MSSFSGWFAITFAGRSAALSRAVANHGVGLVAASARVFGSARGAGVASLWRCHATKVVATAMAVKHEVLDIVLAKTMVLAQETCTIRILFAARGISGLVRLMIR